MCMYPGAPTDGASLSLSHTHTHTHLLESYHCVLLPSARPTSEYIPRGAHASGDAFTDNSKYPRTSQLFARHGPTQDKQG